MNKNIRKSNTEKFSSFFSAIIIVVIIISAFSCENDVNSLGANLIPDEDIIGIEYDTTLTFNSFLTDTNNFYSKNLTNYTIGNIQDPYFGELIGYFAGQFMPSVLLTDVDLENQFSGVVVDSARIFLSINYLYGTPDDNLTLNVYKLNDSIPRTAEFRSNSDVSDYYSTAELINSGMVNQGDTLLVFPLKEDFYSTLVDLGNNFYESPNIFIQSFKGIAIIPENPIDVGGLYNFNIASSYVKLYFSKDTVQSQFSYNFSAGQRFGQYAFDYDKGEIKNYIDLETPSDLIFLQGLGGIKSKISFTNYLSVFDPAYSYSIHSAELSFPVLQDDIFDDCPPPERLFFYTDTNYTLIEDAANSALFNGYFNEDSQEYKFNISKYLKNLLNGDIDNPELYFTISNYNIYPNRVIFKANDNIKLRVTYTKH